MPTEPSIPHDRLRLLECWLPLAQQLNQDLGWERNPTDLEALMVHDNDS